MGKVLIIGAGGVGGVVAHKCAMNSDIFHQIWLASRTLSKCDAIKDSVYKTTGVAIQTAQVNADNMAETLALLHLVAPQIVMNLALPYQDLTLMEACLQAGINYLDTACYEPRDIPRFSYQWQWAYQERFKEKGVMALLGCGFDPGVTNVFCAYAKKHLFDKIRTIDILDCNGGDHGKAFATNFNSEINIREVTQPVRHWSGGEWIESPVILAEGAVHFAFDYPEVGKKESYLLYHEELESLVRHFDGLEQVRFWMTFSENYLNHLRVLEHVGMTSIKPIEYEGQKIIPLLFLKALLPEPSTLGDNYTGLTAIGCVFHGSKGGQDLSKYIYNICDHASCWKEVGAQAISYTTGVPAVVGAIMLMKGLWSGAGVYNMEQMDPDPFLDELQRQGLTWQVTDFTGTLPIPPS